MILLKILPFLLFSLLAFAKRDVEFEWEEVEGARFYQIEIRDANQIVQKLESKSYLFKTKISPGRYQIHGRVYGVGSKKSESDWSDWRDFNIPPAKVIIKPLLKYEYFVETISYTAKVKLDWLPVEEIEDYLLEIYDDKSILKKSHVTKSLTTTLKLRPGYYTIRIIARTTDGLSSEPSFLEKPLLIQSTPVETPKNIALDLKNKRLSLDPAQGTMVNLVIKRQDFLGESWQEVEKATLDSGAYQLKSKLRPGKYQLILLSKNSFNDISIPIIKEFEVKPLESELPSE